MGDPIAAWHISYSPGGWLLVSGPTALVALPEPGRAVDVEQLWRDVMGAGSLDAVLATLGSGSVATMSEFAAFFWGGDGLRGLLRGRPRVVNANTGAPVADGTDNLTWCEDSLGEVCRLRLDLEPGAPEGDVLIPLAVGAALVTHVYLTTEPAALIWPTEAGVAADVPEAAAEPPGHAEPLTGPPLVEPVVDLPDLVEPEAPLIPTDIEDMLATTGEMPEVLIPPPPPEADAPAPEATPVPEIPTDAGTVFSPGLAAAQKAAGQISPDIPQIMAAPCARGHANPVTGTTCRICSAPIDRSRAQVIPAPVMAGVHTNHDAWVDLVTSVIVGRAPDPAKAPAGSQVLRVASPNNDISRSQVLIAVQDWQVVVTDLNSTNGSTVTPHGQAPFVLADGQSVPVDFGTVLDLGDGVMLRVEPPRG
ncbi:MAG: hypothetical protein ACK5KO_03300 [Arachnia sp.]